MNSGLNSGPAAAAEKTSDRCRVSAVIVAGGKGIRMQQDVRKQYLQIGGVPILARTLNLFAHCPQIDRIYAVVPPDDLAYCKTDILPFLDKSQTEKKGLEFVPGGKERQDSVYNGILAIKDQRSLVLVHDAVRPFARPAQISACISAAQMYKAAALGLPVQDTIKEVDSESNVLKTLPRHRYWFAQTPQVFAYDLLRNAHEQARTAGFIGTDDACLVERLGEPVKMVKGDKFNIKITTPEDLALAGLILSNSSPDSL